MYTIAPFIDGEYLIKFKIMFTITPSTEAEGIYVIQPIGDTIFETLPAHYKKSKRVTISKERVHQFINDYCSSVVILGSKEELRNGFLDISSH